MKKLWVKVDPWDERVVTFSLEKGVDALFVPKGFTKRTKEMGLIKTVAIDGDLKLQEDVIEFTINTKEDEIEALKISKSKILIIKTKDWRIIPLENLIAQTSGLILEVKDAKEARTALQILEKGVDGILLVTSNLDEIEKVSNFIRNLTYGLNLSKAKITRIEQLSLGDRVCIDTCTNMKQGEGILVGNSSSFLFLVHSENVENPYVAARPFRVNAGAVHAYTLMPEKKTKYLAELKTGEEILIVDWQGKTQIGVIGRIKIEKRPLILIEGKIGDNKIISLVLQNAETIRLTTPQGLPISIVNLKIGTEVLVYEEKSARHFGIKIEETIIEK